MFMRIISGIPAYPGVFMIRTKLLFDKLDDREIYYNREAGQNYQLLLPVAYDSKCGFIDNVLYKYYVRMDSHHIMLTIVKFTTGHLLEKNCLIMY